MKNYRVFVFDLDGTLVDSRPAIERAAQMAIQEVLPHWCGTPVTTAIGPPIRQMFATALGGIGEATLDRLVTAFRRSYDGQICLDTPAYPNIPAVLASLSAHGATTFVLTNKPRQPSIHILSRVGLEQYVRELVTPDSPEYPFTAKSDALRALMQRHALPQHSTILIGDSRDDAIAAESCGVTFGAALYGYGGLHRNTHSRQWLLIRSPLDILSLLE